MIKRKAFRRRLFWAVLIVVIVGWMWFVHSIGDSIPIHNHQGVDPPIPSSSPLSQIKNPFPAINSSPEQPQYRRAVLSGHDSHGSPDVDSDLFELPIPTNVFKSKGASPFPAATAPLDIYSDSPKKGGITFMVLGDWGGPGRDPQRNVGVAMATVATRSRADATQLLTTRYQQTPPLRQLLRPLALHPSVKANVEVFTDASIAALKHQLLHTDPVLQLDPSLQSRNIPEAAFCPIKCGSLDSAPSSTTAGSDDVVRSYGRCRTENGAAPDMFPNGSLGDALPPSATQTRSWLDFVVSTGDNMYEAGVADIRDRRFKRNFEDVYTHPSLHVPWLMSLGNHDHGAHGTLRDVQGQVNYSFVSPRWLLPSNYYRQTVRLFLDSSPPSQQPLPSITIELFVLDTYDVSPSLTRISRAQLRWFERSLASSVADWRFVVGHRPLYSAGAKHGSSPSLHKLLYPLMAKYNVSAYFCGDDHQLQLMREGPVRGPHSQPAILNATSDPANIMYILSGGGSRSKDELKKGGISRTLFQSAKHGFATVGVTNRDILEVSFVDQHGVELHTSIIANRHVQPPPHPL